MARRFVLSIDQSTQGTKSLLFDEQGTLVCREDIPHEQIVDINGGVSHDPVEIYENVLRSIQSVIRTSEIDPRGIVCLGISNQRETSVVWDRRTGEAICGAIVWHCVRARGVSENVISQGHGEMIRKRTGIPVSPYFPASKYAWILENIPGAQDIANRHELCFGTIDTWLIYKLTGGTCYKTDYSNAARTQLFNLDSLQWDKDVCHAFGLNAEDLADICASDSVFGETDLEGILPKPIPICAVLGDSNAALFGQGCLKTGLVKATYGTGSSIMMNIGSMRIESEHGLVTSLAWKYKDTVQYVMEGNVNYTGAVIRWMQKDAHWIESANETQLLAEQANPADTTYIVPAFTGLGAPYWNNDVRAIVCGISRHTGKAELVKAGLESIAYQITDIIHAMEQDTGFSLKELRVDGGATKNQYLMQYQSDMLDGAVLVPVTEELSGIGAAYMAGISCGVYNESILGSIERNLYRVEMDNDERERRYAGWKQAVEMLLYGAEKR